MITMKNIIFEDYAVLLYSQNLHKYLSGEIITNEYNIRDKLIEEHLNNVKLKKEKMYPYDYLVKNKFKNSFTYYYNQYCIIL